MDERDDEWALEAFASTALVAHELICISRPWKRVPWRQLLRADTEAASPMDIMMEEIGTPAAELDVPVSWTVHRRRRRWTRNPEARICAKDYVEEERGGSAAHASPATPLDFSAASGASASDCEERPTPDAAVTAVAAAEAAKRRPKTVVDGGVQGGTKVATRERPPVLFKVPEDRPIGRPVKKKTLPELQGAELSLLEERKVLQKEIALQRLKCEALASENQRLKQLKLSAPPLPTPIIAATEAAVAKEVQTKRCIRFTTLPDLNEPWVEEII